MIDLIAKIALLLLGVYLVLDSWMLISSTDSAKEKWCYKAKYVSALMSGLCLCGMNKMLNKSSVDLVYATTIALSLWPNTFYEFMNWLQYKHHKLYLMVISKINIVTRRRSK